MILLNVKTSSKNIRKNGLRIIITEMFGKNFKSNIFFILILFRMLYKNNVFYYPIK